MHRFPPLPPAPESPTGYVVLWRAKNQGRWVQIGEADTYAEAFRIEGEHKGGNGDGYWITARKEAAK